jgi:hypothetical protein
VLDRRLYKVYGAPEHSAKREAQVDLSKLGTGQKIFAGAGLVYFIASFLTWYSIDFKGGLSLGSIGDANAWGDIGFLWGSLWALLFLAGIVLLLLPAFGVAAPKLPAIAFLVVGGLATLFTLLKLLIGESDSPELGITISASFGIYLAVIAAAAATYGAFLMFKESGGDLNDLKDMNKIKGAFQGAGDSAPPPPPPPGMSPPPPPPPPA